MIANDNRTFDPCFGRVIYGNKLLPGQQVEDLLQLLSVSEQIVNTTIRPTFINLVQF